MLAHDAVDRRKAKAGAAADLLRREKRIEYFRENVRRDAGAGIGHRQTRILAGSSLLGRRQAAGPDAYALRADRELAAARHCVPGVHGEVQQHLIDHPGISED